MKFSEVLEGMKMGKSYKRKEWGNWWIAYSGTIYFQGTGIPSDFFPFTMSNFEAQDWVEVRK